MHDGGLLEARAEVCLADDGAGEGEVDDDGEGRLALARRLKPAERTLVVFGIDDAAFHYSGE